MKTLYESILGGYSKSKSNFSSEIDNIAANAEDSPLHNIFKGLEHEQDPFSYDTIDGKRCLVIKTDRHKWGVDVDVENGAKLEKEWKVDALKVHGNLTINNVQDVAQNLAPNIYCNFMFFKDCPLIENLNIHSSPIASGLTGINAFGNKKVTIKNCVLNATHLGVLKFNLVPNLINVKSDTIRSIEIYPTKNKGMLWKDKIFNNLFEFNYTVNCCDYKGFDADYSFPIEIKSMTDLKQLVVCKDFHNRTYDQTPYRVKDVNITDIIDVSQFSNIKTISIYEDRIGIFLQSPNATGNDDYTLCYAADTLKQHSSLKLKPNEIQRTKDGWIVLIYRR